MSGVPRVEIANADLTLNTDGNSKVLAGTFPTLVQQTEYRVETADGNVVKDMSDNQYAGLSGETYTFTTANNGPPTLTSTVPVKECGTGAATDVLNTADIELNWSERVTVGSPAVTFTPKSPMILQPDNTNPSAFTVDIDDGMLDTTKKKVTIPHAKLTELRSSQRYTVTFGKGLVTDGVAMASRNSRASVSGFMSAINPMS